MSSSSSSSSSAGQTAFAGKLEVFRRPQDKWTKYWVELSGLSIAYYTVVMGQRGFKKGTFTFSRHSTIDLEVPEQGYDVSVRLTDFSALVNAGLANINTLPDTRTSIMSPSLGIGAAEGPPPPPMIPQSPSEGNNSLSMERSPSMTSIALHSNSNVSTPRNHNSNSTGNTPSGSKGIPGSKYNHQFALRSVFPDSDPNKNIEAVVFACETADDKSAWIAVLNRLILADSHRSLAATYALAPMLAAFTSKPECALEVSFSGDFDTAKIPAIQRSAAGPVNLSTRSLDVSKPSFRYQSAHNGSVGLYDERSAHMGLYTIVVVNLDAWPAIPASHSLSGSNNSNSDQRRLLTRSDPVLVQWLVVNASVLVDQTFSTRTELCGYVPPCPSQSQSQSQFNTQASQNLHTQVPHTQRLVILAFQQPEFIDRATVRTFTQQHFSRRVDASLRQIIQPLGLGALLAINAVNVGWDPHADVIRERWTTVIRTAHLQGEGDGESRATSNSPEDGEFVEFLNGPSDGNAFGNAYNNNANDRKANWNSNNNSNNESRSSIAIGTAGISQTGSKMSKLHAMSAIRSADNSAASVSAAANANSVSLLTSVLTSGVTVDEVEAVDKVSQSFKAQIKAISDEHARETVSLQALVSSLQATLAQERAAREVTERHLHTSGDLSERLAELEKTNKKLVASVDHAKKEKEQMLTLFEKERADYESEIDAFCDKIRSLEGKLAEEAEAKDLFRNSAVEYATRLDDMQALRDEDAKALEERVANEAIEKEAWQSELSRQSGLTEEAKAEAAGLRAEVRAMQAAVEQSREDELAMQRTARELEERMQSAIEASASIEERSTRQQADYENEVSALMAKIKTLEERIAELDEVIEEQQQQLQQQPNMASLEPIVSAMQHENAELNDRVAQLQNTSAGLSDECESLRSAMTDLEREKDDFEAEATELRASNDQLREENERVAMELSEALIKAENNNINPNANHNNNEEEVSSLKAAMASLEAELDSLREQLADEVDANEFFKSSALEFKTEVKVQAAQHSHETAALREEIDRLKQELEHNPAEKGGGQAQAQELERQLEELTVIRDSLAQEAAEKDDVINLLIEEVQRLRQHPEGGYNGDHGDHDGHDDHDEYEGDPTDTGLQVEDIEQLQNPAASEPFDGDFEDEYTYPQES